jgi:hypothetical protein
MTHLKAFKCHFCFTKLILIGYCFRCPKCNRFGRLETYTENKKFRSTNPDKVWEL